MQEITVTFDSLFDVDRIVADGCEFTKFSFISGGMTVKDAVVKGFPSLREGMTITAFLYSPDDWSSLKGWVSHQTRAPYLPPRFSYRSFAFHATLINLLVLVFTAYPIYCEARSGDLFVLATAALFLTFFNLTNVRVWRADKEADRKLLLQAESVIRTISLS
jgi:hypothetical protein